MLMRVNTKRKCLLNYSTAQLHIRKFCINQRRASVCFELNRDRGAPSYLRDNSSKKDIVFKRHRFQVFYSSNIGFRLTMAVNLRPKSRKLPFREVSMEAVRACGSAQFTKKRTPMRTLIGLIALLATLNHHIVMFSKLLSNCSFLTLSSRIISIGFFLLRSFSQIDKRWLLSYTF